MQKIVSDQRFLKVIEQSSYLKTTLFQNMFLKLGIILIEGLVCIGMYRYMWVCMYIDRCMRVYMYRCVLVYILRVCIYMGVNSFVYVTPTHTYTYIYIYTHIYPYTYTYLYKYLYTLTHPHIHPHSCTHLYKNNLKFQKYILKQS